MTAVKKFLFDYDFDAPAKAEAPDEATEPTAPTEPAVPTYSEEDVLEARQLGYAEGREDGIREAAEATEREIADVLAGMPEKLEALLRTQADSNRSIAQETLAVATAIAKKAFPDLNARNALGEIERMVRDVLESVIDEPRVQIVVAPALRDPLTERLGVIAERVGYDGRITVSADKSMKRGDCRVEWNNGGAQRNLDALWMQIDEIVERNLGEDAPHPRTPTEDDAAAAEPSDADAAPETAPAPAHEPAVQTAPPTGTEADEAAPAEAEDATESAIAAAPETAAPPETETPVAAASGDGTADAPAAGDGDATDAAPAAAEHGRHDEGQDPATTQAADTTRPVDPSEDEDR